MSYKTPLRDMKFVMNELLEFPAHYANLPEGENASPEMVDAILEEASKFAENILSPLNRSGDEEGCHFNNGHVTTPKGFKAAYDQYVENGWPTLSFPEALGGQGLPQSLGQIIYETQASSNHAWSMYSSLTLGAIKTITAHASDELVQRFAPKLIEGIWSGTMCLTESHSGSDLGLLRTKAQLNNDNSYNISGSKIFISAGNHDLTENIIHIVLARLPDAPAGIKGISLFVVPKFKVKKDGSVGESNGVTCGSIEEKMGIHGNATCVINFDGAQGFLIGPANKGMSCMFTFINESRLAVAQQAQSHTEASYQKAVAYAKDRLQMRGSVRKLPDQPADPIIVHADVRRMLLTQKAITEGGRALNYYLCKLVDLAHGEGTTNSKQNAETLLTVLTPIAKAFLTELSQETTSYGIQIFGGHGFIREAGQEQEYRDSRITAIYEGTTGIQGLDLLGRKVLASKGKILQPLIDEITDFCQAHKGNRFADETLVSLNKFLNLTEAVSTLAAKGADEVNAAGVDYVMHAGYTTLAYLWAKSAIVAQQALSNGATEQAFYQSKISTAKFYFERLLPRTASLAITMLSGSENLMELSEDAFIF